MCFFLFLSWVSKPKKEKNMPWKKERKKNIFLTYMGKNGKTEVGDEDGEGVKNNPEERWPYFFGIIFNSFPH